ncbi:MAG: hypothetical protein GY826_27825 [Fuerstiella sp.]|nr:hypothetical protein [Fuerstiella sp.]
MRLLITVLVASCALSFPVRSAEPIRLVIVPFDAKWGTRRLPIQPATLLPPPPLPGLNPETGASTEAKPQNQRWCRGGC